MKGLSKREQKIFEAGIAVGKKQMEIHLEEQWEKGKPILANGRLWWIKSDLENLSDIMDDYDAECQEEFGFDM